MPLWDFRAHATWQTCLSSYVFTCLADTWKSHSAGGCIHRCRRLRCGCKPTREDSLRFWQRREVVRALRAAPPITARRAFCSAKLTRAKKQREIRSDADLDSMADFFESTLAGIRMAAKAGKSRHALRNIAAAFASRAYIASDCRTAAERRASRRLSIRPSD